MSILSIYSGTMKSSNDYSEKSNDTKMGMHLLLTVYEHNWRRNK